MIKAGLAMNLIAFVVWVVLFFSVAVPMVSVSPE
jgi:hypothetical protein